MKEIMASAKDNADVLSHLFKTKYKKNVKIIYLVVEGEEDIIYYSQFIEEYLKEGWEYQFIKAPNHPNKISSKKQIIRFFNNLDWRTFNKKQIIILIDRDLSPFIEEVIPKSSNIYVTDGYSIENSILTKRTFCRTICELCNFTEVTAEQKKTLESIYSNLTEDFCQHMIKIMALLIYWMKKGKKIQSNNIKIKELIEIKNAKLIPKDVSVAEYFHKKTQIQPDNCIDISNIEKRLKEHGNYKNFIRGKYLWEFHKLLCLSIINDNKEIPNLNLKKRSNTAPKLDFIDITHLARIPDTLRYFLDCTIKDFIKKVS